MIFSEIYGVYYKAVSEILKSSLSGKITTESGSVRKTNFRRFKKNC